MFDWDDKLSEIIRIFLESKGIDPFYAVTAVCLIASLYYLIKYDDFRSQPGYRRHLIVATIICSIFFTVVSFFRMIGVLDF